MLHYTHVYELVYRLVSLLVSGMLAIIPAVYITVGLPELIIVIIYFGCWGGIAYLILKTTSWIPTFLYIRLTLSTNVSQIDAKTLSFLFDGSLKDGKWYPLLEIKDLPPASRRDALFQFATKIVFK